MTRSPRLFGKRRLAAAEDGAAATEFAIVFPAFFLLLLGIFDFAHACWVVNTLQFAVSQGARYATTTSSGVPTASSACAGAVAAYQTNVQAYLQRQLSPYLTGATVPLPTGNCITGALTVNLTVTYTFTFFLTEMVGMFPHGIPMQQQATVTTPLS